MRYKSFRHYLLNTSALSNGRVGVPVPTYAPYGDEVVVTARR